ncbi:hypothetical protein [Metabacillus arenae]|uniref:Uncharacterized protein n=1 Tax=Metabacillus arenae TaxID=2771434 RepID=A0A926RVW9_9BACI|nr:hypothetical protein [Metabacillus arenae]MBD1379336.1 hypothetical protein [Metabacillus arenae]
MAVFIGTLIIKEVSGGTIHFGDSIRIGDQETSKNASSENEESENE